MARCVCGPRLGERDERDEGLYVGYRLWGIGCIYHVVYSCRIEIGEMQAPLERYPTSTLGQRGPTPRVLYLFFSFRRISPSFSPRGLGLGLQPNPAEHLLRDQTRVWTVLRSTKRDSLDDTGKHTFSLVLDHDHRTTPPLCLGSVSIALPPFSPTGRRGRHIYAEHDV
jgi:hypothetical protein